MLETLQKFYIRLAQGIDNSGLNLPNQNVGEEFFSDSVKNVLNIVFGAMGAIAVLIIVIAGLSYVTANGDPQRTSKAKDAIIYALIGLVVAIMAFAIVNFVLDWVIAP